MQRWLRRGEREIGPIAETVNPFAAARTRARAVIEAVCTAFEITEGELFSDGRDQRHATPRFAIWRILREGGGWSLPQLGRLLKRDHSSALNGLRKAAALHGTNKDWRYNYDRALELLSPGILPPTTAEPSASPARDRLADTPDRLAVPTITKR